MVKKLFNVGGCCYEKKYLEGCDCVFGYAGSSGDCMLLLSRQYSKPSRSFFADDSIHTILFCSLLLRLLSFDLSNLTFLAQTGQYFDMAEPGTYSTPHTVQCLAGNAVHRFVGVICNSSTKPMNL